MTTPVCEFDVLCPALFGVRTRTKTPQRKTGLPVKRVGREGTGEGQSGGGTSERSTGPGSVSVVSRGTRRSERVSEDSRGRNNVSSESTKVRREGVTFLFKSSPFRNRIGVWVSGHTSGQVLFGSHLDTTCRSTGVLCTTYLL